MTISIVVAASTNSVIGKGNEMPWHLPNDMKFFKNATWGLPVIMGRKTLKSLGNKPLAGRINIVVTRQEKLPVEGIVISHSLNDALFVAGETDCNEVCVIGGGEIFKEVIDSANIIYITRVHAEVDGDVFFPEIDETKWKLVSSRDCFADEKHAYNYTFQKWQRS